jgi:hypothetical protein
MLDTDAWIYPLVYGLAEPQWRWLNASLAAVDRAATPWVVVIGHRAMYCTKTTDGECNSEAEALRYGFFSTYWGLEALLLQYGVDLYIAGHTHHYERTWPVREGVAAQLNYDAPSAPVHVQSGIAGVNGNDPFDVPQQPWEARRDTSFTPCYSRLVIHNATHATVEQLAAANRTLLDAFTIVQPAHGSFLTRRGAVGRDRRPQM